MPIYEYRCSVCEHTFEVKGRFDDPPRTSCSECGGEAHRVLHVVGIVFKGNGFYATDNRRPRYHRDGAEDEDGGGGKDGADAKEPAEAGAPGDSNDASGSSDTKAGED